MRQEGENAEAKLGLPEYRGHSSGEMTAFAALILFVAAAAAGAFGGGPVSDTMTASKSGKLQIQYHRFLRRDAAEVLQISVPTIAGAREVELSFNTDYLRRVQITDVFPEPLEVISHQDGRLRFRTDASGQPVAVRLHYQARLPGFMTAQIAVAGQPEQARFKQLVYP